MSNSQSIYAYRRDRSKYRLNEHLDDIETLKDDVDALESNAVHRTINSYEIVDDNYLLSLNPGTYSVPRVSTFTPNSGTLVVSFSGDRQKIFTIVDDDGNVYMRVATHYSTFDSWDTDWIDKGGFNLISFTSQYSNVSSGSPIVRNYTLEELRDYFGDNLNDMSNWIVISSACTVLTSGENGTYHYYYNSPSDMPSIEYIIRSNDQGGYPLTIGFKANNSSAKTYMVHHYFARKV